MALNRTHERFGYAYDAAGNLNRRTNNALVQTFTVNNLNQLSNATRSGNLTAAGTTTSPATNVTVNTLTADRYADRTFARTNLSLSDGNNTFTAIAWDNLGRLDTNAITVNLPATLTFLYDQNGNMRTNGTRIFEYDDENQLTRVTEPSAWKSEFTYDGKMRMRVSKDFAWVASAWVQTNEVRRIYDGMLVLQERDSFNVPKLTYTRGKDVSGSVERAGGIGGLLAMTESSSLTPLTSYFHADGNGNVTCLVDANQNVVARYLYDPFGNTLSATGPKAGVNRFRFSSKECHAPSGLVYYGYRLYVPELQRWLNRDPIGDYTFFRQRILGMAWADKQALRAEARRNHSMFVWNRPTIAMDPEGLVSWIPYYNPNGDGRPIGVPTVDMPCGRAIKETAEMVYLGNRGYEGYPAANDDDRLQHCITSCRLARECGGPVAWLLGWFKESNDLVHGGSAADTAGDLDANTHGRNGKNCPKKSCEDYCGETRGEY